MTTRSVTAGQSLQSAIDQSQLGDVISVEAGATFQGPIKLPAKSGSTDLVIQSSRVAELPQGRVNATHAGLIPKILCPSFEQAIKTSLGAHNYKLDGIEVLPEPNTIELYDLVRFGAGRTEQTTLESVAHHLKMDRCYIHSLPETTFIQRGLTLNSSDTEVTRSCFAGIRAHGMDTQAICSWNTPGRNRIVDNYLEAASENILLGGSDPASADFIPSDYQILHNYCFKPLTWKGGGWNVKNLLEIKNGRNIFVDGNVFENNWTDGQAGIAILFTVRNQEGTAPYSIILNVAFTNNTVRNAEGALNFLGSDNEKPSQRCSGASIKNNVFDKINGHFLTINGYNDVSIERNTHLQSGNTMTLYSTPSTGFQYKDNVSNENPYGVYADGGLQGSNALAKFAPGYVFTGNVLATPYGYPGNPYPAGNVYPPSPVVIGGDYRTEYVGKGADIDALLAAQSGTGTAPPIVTPPPVITPPTPVTRKVAWPTQEGKQDQVLAAQWVEGYRLKRNLTGAYVEFEKVK